jgi:outer membrane protein OmpA-like peptidoglycan-associated protein
MYKIAFLFLVILPFMPICQLNAQQSEEIIDPTAALLYKNSTAYDMLNKLVRQYETAPDSSILVMLDGLLFKYEFVNFETDSHRLSPVAKKILQRKVDWIKNQNPNIQFKVVGHCDQRGSQAHNQNLGTLRANAVKEFLISCGIADEQVQIVSAGASQPIDRTENEKAWAKNRRVEVISPFPQGRGNK